MRPSPEPDDQAECESPDDRFPTLPKVVPAEELFGDSREIWIEFHGERYRLRITRRNKLILQK